MDFAFTFIIENGGIDTEKDYPYDALEETCQVCVGALRCCTACAAAMWCFSCVFERGPPFSGLCKASWSLPRYCI